MNKSKVKSDFADEFIKRTLPILRKKYEKDSKCIMNANEKNILLFGQIIAEIDTSFSIMNHLSDTITTHSSYFEKKGFSRVQQHRKNIEFYLNEAYLLKERTIRLLNTIKNQLLSQGYTKASKEIEKIDNTIKFFLDSTGQLMEIRKQHVHIKSYQDKDLFHIELLDVSIREMNYDEKNKKALNKDLISLLKAERLKWKKTIQQNNQAFQKLLNAIYLVIEKNLLIEKCINKLPI